MAFAAILFLVFWGAFVAAVSVGGTRIKRGRGQ